MNCANFNFVLIGDSPIQANGLKKKITEQKKQTQLFAIYNKLHLKSKKFDNVSGLYALRVDDKIYIGQTQNVGRRLRQHINLLKTKTHSCKRLQDDFLTYRNMEFIFIEEERDKNKRKAIENKFIMLFRKVYGDNGVYNSIISFHSI